MRVDDRVMATPKRCRHRFAGIDATVTKNLGNGYTARCLLCDTTGPVRTNGDTARLAMLDTPTRGE